MLLAVLALVLGVVIPPTAAAAFLVGADAPTLRVVRTGVWLFKAGLIFHGLVLAWWSRRARSGDGAEPGDRPTRLEWLLLAALLVVALGLRLPQLGNGLWYDEIQTLVTYVRLPMPSLVANFDNTNQHSLYSILARVATVTLGESGATLRLPAVLLGVASIAATWWFARRVSSRAEAWLAAILLTVSYHHVWFSQNARGYTGLLLSAVVGTRWFLALLDRPAPPTRAVIGYAVAMALGVYLHVTAVFVVVAHGAIWLFETARSARRGEPLPWSALAGLLLAGTLSFQLYALTLPQFLGALAEVPEGTRQVSWKNPLWFVREALSGIERGLPGGLAVLAVGLGVVVIGWVSYWRQRPALALAMVLPGVVTAAAVLAQGHNLWPRFFFFCLAFAAMIALRGGFVIAGWITPDRRLPIVGAAAVAGLSAWTVPKAWGPKQDYQGAQRYVEASLAPDDAVVVTDLTTLPYARYHASHWTSVGSVAALDSVRARHTRTWVVTTFPIHLADMLPEVVDRLKTEFDTVRVFPGTLGGGEVTVLVSKPAPHENTP